AQPSEWVFRHGYSSYERSMMRRVHVLGITDEFGTPSSRVCTVLSSPCHPQRSFGYACGLSPKSTAHPLKTGAPYFISDSYKNDSDNRDYYFIVMLAIKYSIFTFGMEYFFSSFFQN
ncbi:MAG: hypothetical protein II093_10245, partial [Selenomonas sp.]|nr:hypothetical protein [Selenomonas sp.]